MRRLLLMILSAAAAAGTARAGAILETVRVVGTDPPAVRLGFSAPVAPGPAKSLPADGERPARAYVDLPGATLGGGSPDLVAGRGDLLRVRTGQFDAGTVRVVLDLAAAGACDVRADGRTITITLGPPPAREPPRARAPEPPAVPRGRARTMLPGTIVVDAGHGGHDPGATGIGGVVEKTVALDVARRVAARLAARVPNAVVLTRTGDTFLSIDERLALATDAALFVSLHANAAPDATLDGVEVYYGGGGVEKVSAGPGSAVRLGLEMIMAIERRFPVARTAVRPGTFGVLARNAVPSVLVEVGYLTNPRDASRLGDARHRALVADAVADGVVGFLRDRPPMGVASR